MDFFVTLLHFFQKGGFMMYPIAIVLALSVAITIERWLFLSRVDNENRQLWLDAAPLPANDDVATVEQIASGWDTGGGRVQIGKASGGVSACQYVKHLVV